MDLQLWTQEPLFLLICAYALARLTARQKQARLTAMADSKPSGGGSSGAAPNIPHLPPPPRTVPPHPEKEKEDKGKEDKSKDGDDPAPKPDTTQEAPPGG